MFLKHDLPLKHIERWELTHERHCLSSGLEFLEVLQLI